MVGVARQYLRLSDHPFGALNSLKICAPTIQPFADAGADFEQAGAQGFDWRRTPLRRELEQTKQVDEVVGEAVQEQAEGIGQKAVAAQAVGAEAVLEFLDAVLALAPVVVKGYRFVPIFAFGID